MSHTFGLHNISHRGTSQRIKTCFFLLLLPLLILSCVGNSTLHNNEQKDSDSVVTIVTIVDTATVKPDTLLASLSPQQIDSLYFRLTHHYSRNFNFLVKADSLTLIPREGDMITDTCRVYDNDLIVVADIDQSTDTIWIKVAHDQYTMGWIPESELLQGTTPNDMISELLSFLTDSRGIWMSALIAIGLITFMLRNKRKHQLQILQFDEMQSPYPFIFLALIAMMACLYASIQHLVPEFWVEYYFHPTLNPLQLPLLMAILVTLVWCVIIIFIAVCDEVYHHFYFAQGLAYIVELISVAMLTYLIIGWSTLFYIGYPLLIAFLIALAHIYWRITHKS